eukprot:TRINITY_DN5669_c0_g1_i1.p1 TRINITY_DN5669_c0_g1~~TRINITY_DN5669_c0_g1_i1.p1  ORF type:complete len:256 (-),score=40.50 TRINITY_DN5669_c0_g1_i1:21-737(-)
MVKSIHVKKLMEAELGEPLSAHSVNEESETDRKTVVTAAESESESESSILPSTAQNKQQALQKQVPEVPTITVEFLPNDDLPWGCALDFGKHWSKWNLEEIEPGQQAECLGLHIGDRLIAVDEIKLNESNMENIKEKVSSGDPCRLTFMQDTSKTMQTTKLVTFQPEAMGFSFNGNKITQIIHGNQAEKEGVSIGWTILEVNGKRQPCDKRIIRQAIKKPMILEIRQSYYFKQSRHSQ